MSQDRLEHYATNAGTDKIVSTRNFSHPLLEFTCNKTSELFASKEKEYMTMTGHKMTMGFGIVLFIVCALRSSVVGDNNAVCNRTVSRNESRSIPYDKISVEWSWWYFRFVTVTQRVNAVEYVEVLVREKTCCLGYENRSGICEPKCEPTCMIGYCAQPNICACDHGWTGNFCDEPLLCFVRLNFTEAGSQPVALDSVINMGENPPLERKIPECDSKCSIDSTAFNVTKSGNTGYYLVSIDSPCNKIAAHLIFWKKYSCVMGSVIGILLCAAMIYVIYMVQKKRKTRDKINSNSAQLLVVDYMVENEIYS